MRTGSSQTWGSFVPLREQGHGRAVALLGGLLDRGLEAVPEVEHDVGVEHLVDLVGVELEIVRLGARGREVGHVHAVAADALRGVRDGIEAGDNLTTRRLRVGASRAAHDHRDAAHAAPIAVRQLRTILNTLAGRRRDRVCTITAIVS